MNCLSVFGHFVNLALKGLNGLTLQTKAEGRWIKDVYALCLYVTSCIFTSIENVKQAQIYTNE